MVAEETAGRIGSGETEEFNIAEPAIRRKRRKSSANPGETEFAGFTVNDSGADATPDATVSVNQPLPKQRRCSICGNFGHTARTCPDAGSAEVATKASPRPSKTAVGSLAPMIIGTANFVVVSSWGAECGMTDLESKLAIPSLQRTLERLPAGAAEKASWIIDPCVLLTIVFMWGKRIAAIKAAQAVQKFAVEPTEAARATGVSGFTYNAPAPNGTQNGTRQAQTTEPSEDSTTGNGVPPEIRSGFDANI